MFTAHASNNGRLIRSQGRRRGVGYHLRSKCSSDLLDASVLPVIVAVHAKWIQNQVVVTNGEIIDTGRRSSGDDIQFQGNLPTVGIQRKIVDVLTEGILDFAADSGETENDVCGDWIC